MPEFEVGPWAVQKLDALERYLREYSKIMNRQSEWCAGYVYIDAFAGPGSHAVRGTQGPGGDDQLPLLADFQVDEPQHAQFLRGSPRVALDVEPRFTSYVFIERDPDRVLALDKLSAEHGSDRDVRIRQTDCNEYFVEQLLQAGRVDWSRWRALIFLDPFGMQVPWATVAALAATKGVEVFINFPVGMAIQRLLRKDGNLSANTRTKLDQYFGTDEWFSVIYKQVDNLFGIDHVKVAESGDTLVKWYQSRLLSIFGYVSSARLIRNTHGAHLYYLIHAGPNRTGARIADYILKLGEVVS